MAMVESLNSWGSYLGREGREGGGRFTWKGKAWEEGVRGREIRGREEGRYSERAIGVKDQGTYAYHG